MVEEESVVFLTKEVGDKHAGPSGLGDLDVMEYIARQERIIKRGGGRACNFRRFWTGQNNPPVLFIEHSFAREILIAWHDPVCARVRVYVPDSSYNGKFWMC